MAVPLFTVVSVLSLGYGAFLASVYQPPQPDEVGAIILAKAAADRYEAEREGSCALYEFEQIGATYLIRLREFRGFGSRGPDNRGLGR